jgi:thiol-disulfide isomerase/thioredoxin
MTEGYYRTMKKCIVAFFCASALAFAAPAADLSKLTDADTFWAHIMKLREGPEKQSEDPELAKAEFARFLSQAEEAVVEFAKRFPADARRWNAKLMQVEIAQERAWIAGKQVDPKEAESTFKEVAAAKDASDETRWHANRMLLKIYKDTDQTKYEAQLKMLAASEDARLAKFAKRKLDALELLKKPLDMKFDSVEGKAVDLEKLRGKVVLLDFWATWCPPCRESVPHLVAAYRKYSEKGLEIIGISLDEEKERLVKFTKAKEMTWPQYFDGMGWENRFARRYGIEGIPTLWLVDKKGIVRAEVRAENLEKQIEKLLNE